MGEQPKPSEPYQSHRCNWTNTRRGPERGARCAKEQRKASPRLVRASILTRCQTLDGVAHDGMLVDAAVVEEGHGYASPAAVLPLEGVAPIRLHRVSDGRSEGTRARGEQAREKQRSRRQRGALRRQATASVPFPRFPAGLHPPCRCIRTRPARSRAASGGAPHRAPISPTAPRRWTACVPGWRQGYVERWRLGQVRDGGWAGSAAPECL